MFYKVYMLTMHVSFNFSTFSSAFVFFWFLVVAMLMNGRWYFIVVLICFSLMIGDVEHLFRCLLLFMHL